MASKIFKQFFGADFVGIDGQQSALEPDGNALNRALNYEQSVGNSLRGRVGCQFTGGVEAVNLFGLFPYTYTRTEDEYSIVYQTPSGTYPNQTPSITTTRTEADGASVENVIILNGRIFVRDTMTIPITRVSGTYPFTWYTTVSGSNINFVIKANGVSILNTSLGDGLSSYVSIYSLLGTIDALAELSVSRTTRGTCPPFAIINGNQTTVAGASYTYGTSRTFTVDAGHTFYPGDLVWFYDMDVGVVVATTATTITYVGDEKSALDNEILGYMAQPATSFDISTAATASSGTLNISFPYWRCILEGDRSTYSSSSLNDFIGPLYSAVFGWAARSTNSFYAPPVATSANGALYLAASGKVNDASNSYANNLLKCDGKTVVRAGLPEITAGITITPVGGGALTGTYYYKTYLRRVDAQGNIVEGPTRTTGPTTLAANSATLAVALAPAAYSGATGFMERSCYKHTNESPAAGASFYVDDNSGAPGLSAFIQPGDPVCLTDNTAQTTGLWADAGLAVPVGTLHRTYCTAYTPTLATISPTTTSIKVADSSGYQINDNTAISTGLTLVIVRTTAGGNQYYQLCEVPITGYADITLYDNVTDATLITKAVFTPPVSGKEHNPPPPCTLVCQHQGGLVVARGPSTPNTVSYSTAEGLEYFPTASNSIDVPSTQSGFITAIASDTDDRLAVFKKHAYYDIVGVLDEGSISVNVRNENDYGISSQASLCRVSDSLIGVCENGWMLIHDGNLNPFRFKDLSARIINQKYQFAWATAANDHFNRQYICTIPQVTGEPVSYVIDYSRDNVKTLERSYPTKIDSAGGMVMVEDTLYHLSQTSPYGVFRRLRRFNGDSPGTGDGDSFIDNTNAISYIYESQPINFNEPGLLKSPVRIRIWSIPNDYIVEGWVPFSFLVEMGPSALAQYCGTPVPPGTSSTVSFPTSGTLLQDVKITKCRGHFFILRFTTNTIRTAPFLTGYELMLAENYDKEDFQK